ncbi:hypothetical protein F4804DRAFT_322454, partial [Jackrogersella minutella]
MAPAAGRGADQALTSVRGADQAPATLIRRGEKFFALKKYDHAEKAYQKAISLCQCGVSVQDMPHIEEGVLNAIKLSELKDFLSNFPGAKRCNSQVHLTALDSLVATYESQGRVEEALSISLRTINVFPRQPKSHLRLGKILRLKCQYTTAFRAYKQGIQLVKSKRPDHPLLPKLLEQKKKVVPLATFDPFWEFPVELRNMIFEKLDFKTRCRCLMVSKAWKNGMTTGLLQYLWKRQSYTITRLTNITPQRMMTSLTAYRGYAGDVLAELSVDGCGAFLRWGKRESLFRSCKNLQVLKLREPCGFALLDSWPRSAKLPSLVNLYLGRGVQSTPEALVALLGSCSGSLEELSVFDLPQPSQLNDPHRIWYPEWPRLEKLRVVRLSAPFLAEAPASARVPTLSGIIDSAPNVQEAWMDFLEYNPRTLMLGWPNLRSVFAGKHMSVSLIPDYGRCYHKDMRELHLEGDVLLDRLLTVQRNAEDPDHSDNFDMVDYPINDTPYSGGLSLPRLPKLERLSLLDKNPLRMRDFESLVCPSLESGTLRDLDVRPLPLQTFEDATIQELHFPDWFRGESVEYISLTGFTLFGITENRSFEEFVLGLIDRFPNLRSVDIADEMFPPALMGKIIDKGVKVLHCRPSPPIATVREWAAAHHGAQVLTTPPLHLPAMHPDRHMHFNGLLSYRVQPSYVQSAHLL